MGRMSAVVILVFSLAGGLWVTSSRRAQAQIDSPEEKTPNRIVTERLITKIHPSWIRETLKVSPDNKRVGYVTQVGNKKFLVVDGKEEKPYDGIMPGSPIFSPDSKRVAYAVHVLDYQRNNQFVVIDGKEGKQYYGVGQGSFTFSPDSKRVAHAALLANQWFAVVDGKEGKPYDGIMPRTPIFSLDSRRVAYGAQVGNKKLVVIDRKEGKDYDDIVTDGGGKIIFDSPDSVHYLAVNADNIFLVEERLK